MQIDVAGVNEIVADFGEAPTRVSRALIRALNRAIASGRTVMVQLIARDTGLKSKDVRDAMLLQEASLTRPEASIATSLKRVPLIKFNARGPEPSRGKGRGVTYRLQQGRDRAPNAFIATMSSGHRGVFTRRGRERLPLVELFGPSLGRVFLKYRPQGVTRVVEAFESNFDHELAFASTETSTSTDANAAS